MTDKTNPRAQLDKALAAMRHTKRDDSTARVTLATVACAEALSLLVDAHLAEPERKPEPDPRESLPDDTPVGHGWVVDGRSLLKPNGNGPFMLWFRNARKWGSPGYWRESDFPDTRPATVGDLRRVGVPVTEWPDITAPEPEPAEPPVGSFALDRNGDACFRTVDGWIRARSGWSLGWATLQELRGPVTVVHRAKP